MIFKSSLTLATIALALVATIEANDEFDPFAFTCPKDNGYFEHENCLKFWHCSHGVAHEKDCAPGTQWNQELLTCDHLTTCVIEIPEPETTENPDAGTTEPEEPTTIPENPVNTPDEDDSNDLTTEKPTERPTEEPTERPTKPPKPTILPTTEAPTTTTRVSTTKVPTTTKAPVTTTTTEGPEEFVCPYRNGAFAHHQCWKYWNCINYVPYERKCPNYTQWNKGISECTQQTTCQRPDNPWPPAKPTEKPTEPTKVPTTTTTESPEEFVCPYRYGAFTHHQCWKYWNCINYVPYERTCPKYTQWNKSISECTQQTTCQRPDNPWPPAQTTVKTTRTPKPTTTKAPKTTTTKVPKTTTTEAPEEFECPYRYGAFTHHQCWKYWNCINYVPYERTCPKYTQWNKSVSECTQQTTCQRPDNPWPPAQTTVMTTRTPKPTKTTTTKAPKTTTTKAPKTTTTTTEAPPAQFQCPHLWGAYAHPDCWKFWLCLFGEAREMTCDPYTQFDPRIGECIRQTTCKRP